MKSLLITYYNKAVNEMVEEQQNLQATKVRTEASDAPDTDKNEETTQPKMMNVMKPISHPLNPGNSPASNARAEKVKRLRRKHLSMEQIRVLESKFDE